MAQIITSSWWALGLFGLFVGVFAGLFGLGGGAVIVPLLVLAFHFDQKLAQGTSLAVILSPAAAPAIYRYHQAGAVDWWFVLKVAPFMLAGSYFGAAIATALPQAFLRTLFSFVLIYIAGYMVFSRLDSPARTVIFASIPAAVTVVLALLTGVFAQTARPEAGSAGTAVASAAEEVAD
jgi:uncharacterized membrane protein YfcA